jgi:hypothetical protein
MSSNIKRVEHLGAVDAHVVDGVFLFEENVFLNHRYDVEQAANYLLTDSLSSIYKREFVPARRSLAHELCHAVLGNSVSVIPHENGIRRSENRVLPIQTADHHGKGNTGNMKAIAMT